MLREHTLFTERFRPTDPKDYIGNEVFKSSLNQWIEQQDIPHILLYGPAGTGKTHLSVHFALKQLADKESPVDGIVICKPLICVDNEKFG